MHQHTACSYSVAFDQQRLYELELSPPLTPHKGTSIFYCMRLCTKQSFIPCLVSLQQKESSTGIAKLSVLAHGSEHSKAASVLHVLTEPVKRPPRNFHTY